MPRSSTRSSLFFHENHISLRFDFSGHHQRHSLILFVSSFHDSTLFSFHGNSRSRWAKLEFSASFPVTFKELPISGLIGIYTHLFPLECFQNNSELGSINITNTWPAPRAVLLFILHLGYYYRVGAGTSPPCGLFLKNYKYFTAHSIYSPR